MIPLPLANILHHKLRSALSAAGVALGICMLVTVAGLSRGSVDEAADRWGAVDADLLVYPAMIGNSIAESEGNIMGQAHVRALAELRRGEQKLVQRVVPVYIQRARVGGDVQTVAAVRREDLPVLTGGRAITAGRCFDPDGQFVRWLGQRLRQPEGDATQPATAEAIEITNRELAQHGGMEVVIDSRLARAARLGVGGAFEACDASFTVVGIVPEGGMARVYMLLEAGQFAFSSRTNCYTLLFARLAPGATIQQASLALRAQRLSGVSVQSYRMMLMERLGIMFVYVDVVNAITLTVSFLFILVTLYTMVIQRTREIAILKSLGASRRDILGGVLAESLILTALGAVAGILLSFAAGWAIQELRPLLTVRITLHWIAVAAAAAMAGGTLAAIYPAWCATRVDVIEAINLE